MMMQMHLCVRVSKCTCKRLKDEVKNVQAKKVFSSSVFARVQNKKDLRFERREEVMACNAMHRKALSVCAFFVLFYLASL